LEIPVLQLGWVTTLEESYEQVQTVGEATGHAEEAADVVAETQERIDDAVASVGDTAEGMRVYHELDPTFYTMSSDTFVGSIYSLFGLENIADAAPNAAETTQLSAEYIVGQAPELVVLADTVCCDQSAETLAQRPAFDTIPAVREGRVLEANDDVASRWGPRVAEFAESLATTLAG
jgi:iron complex transport system substrate-binding protein